MYTAVANNTFSYLLTLDEFRREIPEKFRPSWIKLTTITMVSSFSNLYGVHLNDAYSKRDDGLMVASVHYLFR